MKYLVATPDRVVGRHPRAVRVAPDDYRDEIMLVLDL